MTVLFFSLIHVCTDFCMPENETNTILFYSIYNRVRLQVPVSFILISYFEECR